MSEQGEYYPIPKRLESDKTLFLERGIRLRVVYPDLMDNLSSETSGQRMYNRTSGILQLKCGDRRVVFSGDATIEAWESVAANMQGRKPLHCDVMTVPHHGGIISVSSSEEHSCQERLYSEIIKPSFGIVSVGSSNQHNHPLPEAISALREAEVVCTQMTRRCSDDLETIRSLRIPSGPARSQIHKSRTQGGNSRNVACFGSIVAEVSAGCVKISRLNDHRKSMRSFMSTGNFHPLCSFTD